MKALFVFATIILPVSAQVVTSPRTGGTTPSAPLAPAFPAAGATPVTGTPPVVPPGGATPQIPVTGTVPAAGAATIAGPFGSGTVHPAPGLPPINPAGSPLTVGAAPNSRLGFPPPASGPVAPVGTNTGIGGFGGQEASTFPVGSPPFIGNTVGENFVAPITNFPSQRALSVDLLPGSPAQTNAFGIPNPAALPEIAPATPMNRIGAPAGSEMGRVGPMAAPPVIAPPTAPPARPLPPRNPGARLPAIRH